MGNRFEQAPTIPETSKPDGGEDAPEFDPSSDEGKRERVIQTYNKRAEELGLKTDKKHQALLGEWIKADGMENAQILTTGARDLEGRVPTSTESADVIRERLKNIGKCSVNNGVISRIDENGEMLVAPYSDYLMERLKKMGYENGSFFVPLSNGQEPLDKEKREKWQRMRDFKHKRELPYVQRGQHRKKG